MINVEQRKEQDHFINLGAQQACHRVRKIGQLRHAKMHVSCFAENIDRNNILTSTQRELLEASLALQTISTKVLAAHLHRTPANIRTEFQRILSVLGDYGRRSTISHATENEDLFCSRISNK